MAIFKLKADLPTSTRQEIDRVLAIASGLRTSVEAAFIAQIDQDYLYNKVELRNLADEILIASGYTIPAGASGFAKGATFIKSDVAGISAKNIGDSTTSIWLVEIFAAGAPVDYTDGDPVATGQDYATTGSRYTNLTTGDIYVNTGDEDEPVWSIVTFTA